MAAYLGGVYEIDRSVDALQQSRLAGVGGPDDAEDLLFRNLQREVPQRRFRAVSDGDVLEADVGIHGVYHFFLDRR